MTHQSTQEMIAEEVLMAGLKALQEPRQPAHDLWPEIAERIALQARPTVVALANSVPIPSARQRSTSRWPAGLAASLAVAVLAGLMLPQYLTELMPSGLKLRVQSAVSALSAADFESANQSAAMPSFAADGGSDAQGHAVGGASSEVAASLPNQAPRYRTLRSETEEWRSQSGLMRASFHNAAAAEPGLEPKAQRRLSKATFEGYQVLIKGNLRLIVAAEKEVQRALRADPGSESLQEMLIQIHAQQAELERLLVAARR